MALIREGDDIPEGHEVLGTVYQRTFVCGHCGYKLALAFYTEIPGNDNMEQQADHLIKNGWSHIDGKLSCPSCHEERRRRSHGIHAFIWPLPYRFKIQDKRMSMSREDP